jgi:hypothetical protein
MPFLLLGECVALVSSRPKSVGEYTPFEMHQTSKYVMPGLPSRKTMDNSRNSSLEFFGTSSTRNQQMNFKKKSHMFVIICHSFKHTTAERMKTLFSQQVKVSLSPVYKRFGSCWRLCSDARKLVLFFISISIFRGVPHS